jgi:FkbM family methyltransferase
MRLQKLARVLAYPQWLKALLAHRVAAGAEHLHSLSGLRCLTVVDVGANRGQFSLLARRLFPAARIIAFEPLPGPARVYRSVFDGDSAAILHPVALGCSTGPAHMHVALDDDSSSLLPITPLQEKLFPGTGEFAQETVSVGPLDAFVSASDVQPPALLKIDVQGYELEALKGCETMLDRFSHVYVECSFVELYSGQASASEVADYLHRHGFALKGVYNLTYDRAGVAIQGDFLYSKASGAQV